MKDCLKQNEELRGMLDKLRTEKTNMPMLNEAITQSKLLDSNKDGGDETRQHAYLAEVVSLKVRLYMSIIIC